MLIRYHFFFFCAVLSGGFAFVTSQNKTKIKQFSQKLLSDSVNGADVNGLHMPLKIPLCHILVMSATFLSHNYLCRCAFALHLTQSRSVSRKHHPLLDCTALLIINTDYLLEIKRAGVMYELLFSVLFQKILQQQFDESRLSGIHV